MKQLLLFGYILLCNACISTTTPIQDQTSSYTSEAYEPLPNTDASSSITTDILIGKQDRKALEQEPFGHWFHENYKNYTIDTATVSKIAPHLSTISIKAFMGTWCSDSKRETPTFYKLLDAADFDYDNLELITVSREKDTPNGLEEGLNILRVPTFIFHKDGKEIGRYVEFARETLEKDILAIVSGQPYKHSYED
ncbi:thioredoxin family protein [Aquimarina sp. U1-2]|uniref:TlpA family protein disulfide reductase n=1 Tax=Aquimarina sp. U1-2 TaxID=2823141 RepID=UPI001AECE55C|nr:thioredoxin family protein [Aquimarina sp. U1-2]MBP2834057.1 thioredoxin family protein [Aquimarina sp. U1-2]